MIVKKRKARINLLNIFSALLVLAYIFVMIWNMRYSIHPDFPESSYIFKFPTFELMLLAGLIVALIQSYCLYMACKMKMRWWLVALNMMSVSVGVTLILISMVYLATRTY